jgi:hypothetical protein
VILSSLTRSSLKNELPVSQVLRCVEGSDGQCVSDCAEVEIDGRPFRARKFTADDVDQGRFYAKVEFSDGCWNWKGAKNSRGYGSFSVAGKTILVHRISVVLSGREIPDGLLIDHICRNKSCVNPGHLRVATFKENAENTAAVEKTHCKHGHEYTPANTIRKTGFRNCRTCQARYYRNWSGRKTATLSIPR